MIRQSFGYREQKKDGGIRMAVDYREVNMQLEATANQLPYQPQRLGGGSVLMLKLVTLIMHAYGTGA